VQPTSISALQLVRNHPQRILTLLELFVDNIALYHYHQSITAMEEVEMEVEEEEMVLAPTEPFV
jgi:hypothetical protein